MDTELIFPFSLFFLFICTGGFACNPGWASYKEKCFQVSLLHADDVRMARRFCMVFGGDLADITSDQDFQFLKSLSNYDAQNKTYWLKENSHLGIQDHDTTPLPNSCAYADSQRIEYGNCEEKRNFICEIKERSTDLYCPGSWHLYGSTCYKAMSQMGTYNESLTYCSYQNGQLAILDDIAKEHHSAAVIIGQNRSFLVNAIRDNGTFMWSNGNGFEPSCPDCVQDSQGDCLGFESSSEHPTLFMWVYLNCSDVNSFLCQMTPLIKTTTSTTPEPTTTTTLAPLRCPVGYNWKVHETSGFCFWETTYETERLNWYQARTFCQAYGGDLATYLSAEQEDYGLGGAKGHYRGLWFGLERGKNDIFTWVDGTQMNYTNWDYAEPNLRSRSKYCGVHGAGNSKWELDYCGVRRWFICKSPKVRRATLPNIDLFKKIPCNISSASVYRHQWYLYKDHCYMIHEDPKYSWNMAQNFCNDNDAHLVSVHSFAETDFILLLGSIAPNTDYWIGLSSRGLGSSYTWSDTTPLDFLYWADNFVRNETESIDSCVTFEKQRGFWQTDHCNRFLGVICKRGINSSFELPTPEPTPLLPGNCESGWYNLGNHCYKTFGQKWSQREKWNEAKESCQSVGANLASIHSKEEQDFLMDLILGIGYETWIGLQNVNRGAVFQWNDDTPLDFTNWNTNEPTLGDIDEDYLSMPTQARTCVELEYDTSSMGKWNDVSCTRKNAYICQKLKDRNITESSESLFACSNHTGWSKLGSSCYGFFDETSSWLAAQRKCRGFDANLVSFRSSATGIFLKKRLSMKYQFFWTGVRETAEGKYVLLNGRSLKYANWLSGQPQKTSSMLDNCVAMNAETQWMVHSCKENLSFVCEWNPDDGKEEVIEERHSCPNISEWEDIGGDSCYIFSLDYRLSWNDAMFYCFRHGGSLASFHSEKEATLVQQHLLENFDTTYLHIGLGKRKDGSFGWIDNSPVDFTYWDADEPRTYVDNCVQLFVRNGKWRNVDCDDALRGFICSASRSKDANSEAFELNSTEKDIVSSKLAVGGIFGIIICLLVVVAIAGVTAYHLCPSTRMRVTLLEPESP